MMKNVSIALACLSLAACYADTEPSVDDEEKINESPTALAERYCPDDSFLTFEDFGGPFMYNWCNGCHATALPEGMRQDAPLGVDFDTIDNIQIWADRIWARSADHNVTMPPVGGPDEIDRELLGEWLACGALGLNDVWDAP